MSNGSLMIVDIGHDSTDEELLGMMRSMKVARECGLWDHIRLTIAGYNSDPREIWDIPSARQLCQRLVEIGFVSYLDFGNMPGTEVIAEGKTLGAAEVILMAEGRMKKTLWWTKAFTEELFEKWVSRNEAADALVGPMKKKGA